MRTNQPKSPSRLVVELSDKQFDELGRLLPWGIKGQLFRIIVDDLIRLLKVNPDAVIGGLMTRQMSISDFPSFKQKGETPDGYTE